MPKEKTYKDFSPLAKKGFDKFSRLGSSASMKAYAMKFQKAKKMNPYNIYNKEQFFSYVARARLRSKK